MPSPKPYHDNRPWGYELWLTAKYDSPSMVKIITVNPGESLSMQYHKKRDEFWYVLSGDGTAEIGNEKFGMKSNENYFAPKGTNHRITGGDKLLTFIELSFGEFDENDIVRLEDKYGRVTT